MATKVKGSATAKSRADELMRRLKHEHNFDPLAEVIKLVKTSKKLEDKDKVKICQDLMQYQYPKMKAIEISSDAGQPVIFNFDLGNAQQQQNQAMHEAA